MKETNYIVFDLEFNQAWDFEENKSAINLKCPFEIIQVGALQLDEEFEVVSTFDRLVKPQLYTHMHPFVKQITGITIENLAFAKTFKEVYADFIQFAGDESILCTWGVSDIKELLRNVKYHKLKGADVPKRYINIQLYASKHLHCPKGTNVGLRNAVELLNIPLGNKFHDAFNDAYYTAEVFKHIYTHDIKPALYHANKENRLGGTHKKTRLDTHKLIRQFEKMYNRPMTKEEQAIIKLAYMMGKTRQFQSAIQS